MQYCMFQSVHTHREQRDGHTRSRCAHGRQRDNLFIVFATWIYLIVHLLASRAAYILTYDDLLLCYSLFIFVAVEGCVAWNDTCVSYFNLSSGINIYTACLMLFAFRIHSTFDNPYTGILSVMFGTRSFIKYFSLRRILATLPGVAQRNEIIIYKQKGHETVIMPYQILVVATYTIADFSVFGFLLYFGIKLSSDHLFDAIQQQILLYVTCLLLAVIVSIHDTLRE